MCRFVVLVMLSILSIGVAAQEKITIAGKVTDMNLQPVPFATVHLLNTTHTTRTGSAGEFSFSVFPGKYSVHITAVGFAALTDSLNSVSAPKNFILHSAALQLDEVVVTAQKEEEALQQIPLSITALSSSKVREYRLWNAKDITGIIPTMYSANPGDNRNVTSIRGITTTSYDPAVATYIDGVNQFGLDTYIAELIDIERIEVLRGPQGTLYGRNAMGGVINIITKKPANELRGQTEVSFGNYGQRRLGAGLSAPLLKDKLYAGAYVLYNASKGFYDNTFTNSDYDKQSAFTGNYFVRYQPSSDWTVSLNLKHYANRNNGPFPLVFGVEEAFKNPYTLNQNAITTMHDNSLNASASVNHYGKKVNFSSQTAYQSNHRFYNDPIDGDFSPLDGMTIINNYGKAWNNVKVYTQEFRFSNAAGTASPINWSAGAFGFISDNPVKQTTRYGADAGMLGAPDTDFSTINTTRADGKGIAVYGQASYFLTPRLELTGGLRYDYEHRSQSAMSQYQKDPNPDPVFDILPDTTAEAGFRALSPKVALSYHSTDAILYGVYSQGFRAGGFTQIGQDPSSPPLYAFDPEFSSSAELGMKNTFFNKRLQTNIALFYTTVRDVQVPTLVLPEALTVTRNAGKLESRGIELELNAQPFAGFSIDYSFGYTDAQYQELKLPVEGNVVDLQGRKQLFTPDITSFTAIQYVYSPDAVLPLQLVGRLEWMYLGNRYFDLMNNLKQGANHVLNARVGIRLGNGEIMFWARNFTDSRYIGYAYDFGAVHLANPKNFGITVSSRF